jgi:uncharacterized protein (TIGR03067 family)
MKAKMLFLLITGVMAASVCLGRAAARSENPAQSELKKLQGAWTVIETQAEGQKGKPRLPVEWVFRGNELFLMTRGKTVPRGFVTLDPSRKPKIIDVMVQGVPVSLGIYELKGNTLKLCWTGTERPTAFAAQGNATVEVLERVRTRHVGHRRVRVAGVQGSAVSRMAATLRERGGG